jgi:Replication protein C (RepC)
MSDLESPNKTTASRLKKNGFTEAKAESSNPPDSDQPKKETAKTNDATEFELTHARHDPAHCLAPGLFRSLKKGDRKKLKLDITYTYGKDKIEFKAPEPLGVDDLRVLQGLVAIAGLNGLLLSSDSPKTEGQQLRLFIEPKWEAVNKDLLVVKGSYRHLAREIGYTDVDGGKVFRLIRETIERLWTVSIIVQVGKQRMGFRLLSEYASDEEEGKLFIALNPRITEAILGERPHARIDMREARLLHSDPARLLHQRLSGIIDPGKQQRFKLDTLIEYIWPDQAEGSTLRKRRLTTRAALKEIESTKGWTVKTERANCYLIGRKKTD